ncbi:MAG: PTS sugar transporter subunit IIA [Clostridiaceae bacterium]
MDKLINTDLIVLGLDGETKEDVIRKMASLLESQGRISNYEEYVKAVLDREEVFPTAVGYGVSIPHGKTDAVKQASLAFARLNNAVKWSDEEDEDAKYVFLIAVPESEAGNKHLMILADISRKIMREEFREKLEQAQTELEVFELLKS